MLEILNLALNNNYIYIAIIAILIIVIIVTCLSIKKDRDKLVKKNKPKEVEPVLEPAKSPEEQEKARLELEKVVNSMKQDIEKQPNPNEIVTYEQEQEDKAIISYQELVDAVRKNNPDHQPQTEVGMEVAEQSVIEEPTPVEEQMENEELDKKVDSIIDTINHVAEPVKMTEPVEVDTPTISAPTDDLSYGITEEVSMAEPVNDYNVDLNNDSEVGVPSFTIDREDVSNSTEEVPVHASEPIEKKFQTSEFISPIYGRQPQGEIKPVEPVEPVRHAKPDKTPTLDDVINEDLSNADDFLNALKNFKDNL